MQAIVRKDGAEYHAYDPDSNDWLGCAPKRKDIVAQVKAKGYRISRRRC